jgi:CubicO group peptidase (beta-lactamase class C family)
MKLRRALRTIALGLLPALAAHAGMPASAALPTSMSIEGHWDGTIEIPGMQLGIDVDLARAADGSWSGDISIPLQNAKDLPLAGIEFSDGKVSFAISGIPGEPTFSGTVSADGRTIRGDFTQGGQAFPFSLESAAAASDKAQAALEGFDELVLGAMKELEVPGAAVGIVVDGKVVLARGYGVRELGKEAPVTDRTLFAIGSATKAFSTFVMGQLVDEGILDWDKPVASFLPGFRLHDRTATELMTPRDLVTHRSGLPRHDLMWYNAALSRREMIQRLPHLEPNHSLRAKFQYNNAMFLTAGFLVEHLTGKSWEDNVRERIFEPLGMTRSNFSVLDSQKSEDFAHPHSEREDVVKAIPFRVITNVGPAGSINSSVEDMTKWLQVQLGGGRFGERTLIGAATLADMHSPHMPTGGTVERPELSQASYGLGWFLDTYRGHQRVHHGGGIDGFITMVTLLPRDGIGVVAFVNRDGTGLPELIVRSATDRLLGLEPIDWIGESVARRTQGKALQKEAEAKKQSVRKPGTSPAHKLEAYVGDYEHGGYGTLAVALRDGRLEMTYNGIATPLEHWHFEVFNGAEGAKDPVFENLKVLFQTNVDGEVAAAAVPFEPQVADIVFKKKPDARLSDPAYLARFVGDYELASQTMSVGLSGSTLTVTIPGQPTYHLVPATGGKFTLKEYSIVSIGFDQDAGGKVTAIQLYQPNGVFTATRKAP